MSDNAPWSNDPTAEEQPWLKDTAASSAEPWKKDKVGDSASWWSTIKAIPEVTTGGIQQGVGGAAQAVIENVPTMGLDVMKMIGQLTGGEESSVAEIAGQGKAAGQTMLAETSPAKAAAGIAESGSRNIEEVTPQNLDYWQRAVLSGASSGAQQLPWIALSIASGTPASAIVAAGIQQGGQTYAESRQAGEDPSTALGRAAVDATAEAGFEAIPMKFLVDKAGGPVLKLLVGTIAREVPTEIMTTAVQSANARFRDMEAKGKPWSWKEYGQDLLDTIGATVVASPLMAGGAGAMHRVAGREPAAGEKGDVPPPPPATSPLDSPAAPQLSPMAAAVKGAFPDGGDNSPLSPPFDIPTHPIDSKAMDELKTLIDSIDAELLTKQDLEEAKKVVQEHNEKKNLPPNPEAEAAWLPLQVAPTSMEDIGELGASSKQSANAINYINPNTGDRLDREFLYGPEGYPGLTPRQAPPRAGTFTLGKPSEDRPADYLRALHDTVEQWRQKYMPNSTIVLSNEQLFTNSALGWHYQTGPGMHIIVPAVLRNPSKGLGAFNVNTQASAFYNVSHEFGHALVLDRFFEGMAPEVVQQVQRESQTGLISEELIGVLPAAQQAVVREFNALKQAILENRMTAQEFVDTWMSPGKIARKTFLKDLNVAPTDTAQAVMKAIVNRAVKNRTEESAKAIRNKLLTDYLSLDEYLAEQTARHAYSSKWDQKTPLGQFFKGALDSLRGFFVSLKKDSIVKPGTAFTEWIEGLSKADRPVTQGERIAEGKKKGGKSAQPAAASKTQKKPAADKKKVKRIQHNVETDTSKTKEERARKLVTQLVQMKVIDANDENFKDLLKFIRQGDWDEYQDLYSRLAGKAVKFEFDENDSEDYKNVFGKGINILRAGIPERELTPEMIARAHGEWQRKGFRSSFFKAWFGDWENDPEGSSKIRVGATFSLTKPSESLDFTEKNLNLSVNTLDGWFQGPPAFGDEPLVAYHATFAGMVRPNSRKYERDTFDTYTRGDIGFHSGTVKAAHDRLRSLTEHSLNDPHIGQGTGAHIQPIVLNIRNPLVIQDDLGHWDPHEFATYLERKHLITPVEKMIIWRELDALADVLQAQREEAVRATLNNKPITYDFKAERYRKAAPLREFLVAKGWDGIVYVNGAEDAGSASFIAFHPNQIKSVIGSRPFSRSDKIHFELDLDGSSPDGVSIRKLWDSTKNFVNDPARLRRATRRVQHLGYKVLGLQQLAHINPDVSELGYMSEQNTEYVRNAALLQADAESVATRWQDLGKDAFGKVSKFLIAEGESDQHWFDLKKGQNGEYTFAPNETTLTKLREHGIDPESAVGQEAAAVILDVKNALMRQIGETEKSLLSALSKRFAGASMPVLAAQIKLVKHDIYELRKRPFFPQGRFGNLMLIIERDKTDGPGREIVWKEAFEDRAAWEKAVSTANAKKAANEYVIARELTDQQYVMMSLPLDFLDLAASELDLTSDQVEQLMQILQPVRREKALKSYEAARLGLKGYSADALRSFANFTWHNANLISKIKYRAEFNLAIRGVQTKLREVERAGDIPQVERLTRIRDYMQRTRDYVMSPPNEAHTLRAAVSIGYLGLNIKTATMNLYSLSFTWADITDRLGQVEGDKVLLKAYRDAFRSIKLTSLNDRRAGNYLQPEAQQALDRAIKEGVLSQSYAYHLAGIANAGNLRRLFPGHQTLSRYTKLGIDASMYVFRLTELYTRRATFLAWFEVAKRVPGNSLEDAYNEAVKRTNLLQNAYDRANRSPFMRGVKSDNKVLSAAIPAATIFMTFMQHASFHAYGGYELGERRAARLAGETPRQWFGGYTMKMLLLLMILAGYEGLPGMENLMDVMSLLWRKFGGQKPFRQELRELVQAIDGDPELFAHGLGHNIAGYDISRSIGFGRIVPGTDVMARNSNDVMSTFGNLVLDVTGPMGGFIKFGLEAAWGNKPPQEAFQRLPGGIGNIYTAYRWSQEGVRAPSGALVTHDLETGKLRDLTTAEIVGKALGFSPTVVGQNREIAFEQHDQQIYWQNRRSMLLRDVWRARLLKDREAEADARKAVTEYNMGIPAEYKDMRISGADISRSLTAHRKGVQREERQQAPQRRFEDLYKNIRKSFE